jgi:hypothetical protein
VNGEDIPGSPRNDAGSLTAAAETSNAGGSTGFAGMPYWGNTVQTLPGTINGVPNQFGAGQVQLPFAVLPGYVASSSDGTPDAEQDFGYGRVRSASRPTTAESSASYGTDGAPNRQQDATASTVTEDGAVSAVASGSSAGFVSGPLEVAHSTAQASITQTVGQRPRIEATAFGRFTVAGQEFGFDRDGFRYLGQAMSGADALAQANTVLKAAGMQIDLAPTRTAKDGDRTSYTIGGLQVTTTGGGYSVTYILGRAEVRAALAELAVPSDLPAVGLPDVPAVPPVPPAAQAVTAAAEAPSADPDTTMELALPPVVGDVTLTQVQTSAPRTLGYTPIAGRTGEGSQWLFAMLILAGLGVLGGHVLFGRFAAPSR